MEVRRLDGHRGTVLVKHNEFYVVLGVGCAKPEVWHESQICGVDTKLAHGVRDQWNQKKVMSLEEVSDRVVLVEDKLDIWQKSADAILRRVIALEGKKTVRPKVRSTRRTRRKK